MSGDSHADWCGVGYVDTLKRPATPEDCTCGPGRSTSDDREALRSDIREMRGYDPCRCGRTGRWAHKPDDRCLPTAPARTTS